VDHDRYPIACQAYIELNAVGTGTESLSESGEGILRRDRGRATMTDDQRVGCSGDDD
jgi:hypothetical protein